MKVTISGSRSFDDRLLVDAVVERLVERGDFINVGDARSGVDSMVRSELHAREHLVEDTDYRIFEADWTRHGRRAGYLRNERMIRDADRFIAIFSPGQMTPGTKNALEMAWEKGIPISIYRDRRWFDEERDLSNPEDTTDG